MSNSRIPKHVRQYKDVLRRILDSRPSGTRQRLAAVLGTNRSFVSQISSPTYKVAIPAQHIDTIFEVCHFSPAERIEFLAAYDAAHPDQRQKPDDGVARRTIEVTVPDMGNARANRLVDEAIRDMARNMMLILQEK
ncbi:hypothetical protein ACLBWZ_06035 [Brucellaceae bacterium C25G]